MLDEKINLLKNGILFERGALILVGFVITVASAVLFGWMTRNPTLIQIHATFTPMQINTALSFLFIAMAVLGILKNQPKKMLICGLIVWLISTITIVEYLFGINLGIDMVFTDFSIMTHHLYPGRMAPNTAFCFAMIAIVLIWYYFSKQVLSFMIMQLMLFIVFIIGMTAVSGYIFSLPYAYGWGVYTKMALHTAILFMMITVAISFSLTAKNLFMTHMDKLVLPLSIFTGASFLFLLIWNAQLSTETTAIRTTVKGMQLQMMQQINITLDVQIDALTRIAKRWEARGGVPKDEWMSDAKSYYDDFKVYRAIEWVDPYYRIRWIQPLFGNEAALNYDLSTLPDRKAALDAAGKTGATTATGPVDLVQGNRGVVIFAPIIVSGKRDGYIVGVLDFTAFFNIILAQSFYEQFSIELRYNDNVFYHSNNQTSVYLNDFESQGVLSILGHDWVITLKPTEQLIQAFQTMTPAVTLLLGLLMSLVIAIAWYLINENRSLIRQSQLILDSAQAGLLKVSLLGECEEVNSQLCILLSETRKNILDRGWLAYVDPAAQEKTTIEWHDALTNHKDYLADFKIVRTDGVPVWVQCYASVYLDESFQPQAYIITFYNIDSLKQTELKLQNLSYKDELTDLPNRRYFIEVLKSTLSESLRYRRKFTLIYIDIDFFKEINDTLGHGAGDILLKELGQRFKHLIRGTDFIARMGGDEFCLIMREASSIESIQAMLNRVAHMMGHPILIDGQERIVTISMGVVIYANESISYEELLERADAALYKAKTAGRNNVQFYG